MKTIVLLSIALFLTVKIYSQCVNADFSSGDFTNWNGSRGENSGGVFSNEVAGIDQGATNSLPSDPGRQTIINQGYWDPNTGTPPNALWSLPPGGGSCARLGNSGVNAGAERLYYTLHVTPRRIAFSHISMP